MAVSSNPSQGTTHPTQQAKDKVQDLTDRARTTAANVADKARDTASNVADKARDTASQLSGRAEDALSTVGEKMTSLADQLREHAPREGTLGNAASTVADSLRTSGRYLQEHDFQDMGQDMTRLVRNYPVQSLLFAFGIGALMGMTITRR